MIRFERAAKTEGFISVTLFLGFLGYYYSLIPETVVPGDPAQLLSGVLGLAPFSYLNQPIWQFLVRSVSGISGNPVAGAHGLSLLCGAASVGLLYSCVRHLPCRVFYSDRLTRQHRQGLMHLAGVVSALVFGWAPTVQFASVTSQSHTFSLLLALLSFRWFLVYVEKGAFGHAVAVAVLCGVGLAEWHGFLVLTPVLFFWGAWLLFLRRQVQMKHLLWLGGGFLGPLMLISLPTILEYVNSSTAEYRSLNSVWGVGVIYWKTQFQVLTRSVSRAGWILVALYALIPFLILINHRSRSHGKGKQPAHFESRDVRAGRVLLLIVASVLLILQFMGHSSSPWQLFGLRPVLVSPYLLMAVSTGLLVPAWVTTGLMLQRGTQPMADSVWRKIFYPVAVLSVVLVAWRGSEYRAAATLPGLDLIADYQDHVTRDLPPDAWLITEGILEDSLRIHCAEKGRSIRILNRSMAESASYQRWLADQFEDPRLSGLTSIGFFPLFEEWMQRHPEDRATTYVDYFGDLWRRVGFKPAAEGLVYAGKAPGESFSADSETYQELVKSFPVERFTVPEGAYLQPYVEYLRGLFSKAFNNAAATSDDLATADAIELYRIAMQYDPDNISARINWTEARRQAGEDEDGALLADLVKRIEERRSEFNLSSLIYRYGYLDAETIAPELGIYWASLGNVRRAIRELEQYEEEVGAGRRELSILGTLYASDRRPGESETVYRQLLETEPQNAEYRYRLYTALMQQNKLDAAENQLDQLSEFPNINPRTIQLEQTVLQWLRGDHEKAAAALSKITTAHPRYARAVLVRALLELDQEQWEDLEDTLERLANLAAEQPSLYLPMALLHMAKNDFSGARVYGEQYLQKNPQNEQVYELLLKVAVRERDQKSAMKWIRSLLALNPRHIYANHMLATLQVSRGNYEEAAASLRICLDQQSTPELHNDLAWTLYELNQYGEALVHAKKAVDLNPRFANAWHTLGRIHLELRQFEAAESAARRGLQVEGEPFLFALLLSEACLEQGKTREAKEALAAFQDVENGQYPVDWMRTYQNLQVRLSAR